MSFLELPIMIVEKILHFVDKAEVYKMSQVSSLFREAVHHLAVVLIRNLVEGDIVEAKHLIRIGWVGDVHTVGPCSCIDIAFRYKPFGSAFQSPLKIIEPESVRLDKSSYTVGESGIYYGFVNRSSNPPQLGMFLNNPLGAAALMANSSLLAMNRNGKVPKDQARPSSPLWRYLKLHVKGNMLLSLAMRINLQSTSSGVENLSLFEINIYDTRSLQLCYTLDFSKNLPEDVEALETCSVSPSLGVTKTEIAIHLYTEDRDPTLHNTTLFYKIDSENPGVEAEYLCSARSPTAINAAAEICPPSCPTCPGGTPGPLWISASPDIRLNRKYFVVRYHGIDDEEENPRLRCHLMIFQREFLDVEPSRLEYAHASKDPEHSCSLKLEGGDSPFIMSWENDVEQPSVILLDLESKQELLHVQLSGVVIPCNWYGGVFVYADVRADAESQLCLIDPRTYPASNQPRVETGTDSKLLSTGRNIIPIVLGRVKTITHTVCKVDQVLYVDYQGLVVGDNCQWAEQVEKIVTW